MAINESDEQQPAQPDPPAFKFDFEALAKSAQNMPDLEKLRFNQDALIQYCETLFNNFELAAIQLIQGVPSHNVAGFLAATALTGRHALKEIKKHAR